MSPIAQVCLYGTRETGFAYLASGPKLSSPIAAKGGWSTDETRPSGHYLSLTEIIDKAKADLRALGIRSGEVIVFFPGGERCAHTSIDEFEAAARMKLEPAPVVLVTADAIANAARGIGASSPSPALPQLGTTTSGKPVPHVPARLGSLEKAASAAVEAHGLSDPKASPAIRAATSALHAHFDAYAREFTVEDHRDAEKLIADHKWASRDMDRYLRYAHNGLEALHRHAIEAAEKAAREGAWRR